MRSWRHELWARCVAAALVGQMAAGCGLSGGDDPGPGDEPAAVAPGRAASGSGAAPPSVSASAADQTQAAFPNPVSNTGAFVHDIPIEVPEGPHGVQPQLHLTYSSQGGVGVAGVGWELPLGVISLSGKDGYRPRALSTDLDRYADGTPVERYTSHLGAIAVRRDSGLLSYLFNPNNDLEVLPIADATGATWINGEVAAWRVRSKDGTTHRYGYQDQASLWQDRTSAAGKRKVAWYVDQTSDAVGNLMSYYYEEYPNKQDVDRQPVLRAIEYGMPASNPSLPYRYVLLLSYQKSPWHRFSNGLGTGVDFSYVLDKVCLYAQSRVLSGTTPGGHRTYDVQAGSPAGGGTPAPLYCYDLTYAFEGKDPPAAGRGYSGRPLLVEVAKVGSDGSRLTPWKFTYTAQSVDWSRVYSNAVHSPVDGTSFWTLIMPPGAYLSRSGHDVRQQVGDYNGDGVLDAIDGDPGTSFPVHLGDGERFATESWSNPLSAARPVSISATPVDVRKDSARSNCWWDFVYTLGFTGGTGGLGYASALTRAPATFSDIHEASGTHDEYESAYTNLGAFQFLSSSYYGPYPSFGWESLTSRADTVDELETFGSFKDTKEGEYAFDWRSSDCQDAGDQVDIDYCWDLGASARTGTIGDELTCLDYHGSRWFTQDWSSTSYSSRLWELRDLDGDGLPDWVYAANIMERDAGGALRDMHAGANDWYVAFGNGDGWDPPVSWHMPAKDGEGVSGVDFVHSTGLLSTAVSKSGAAQADGLGLSVCLGGSGLSAKPIVGGTTLPTSPAGAATMAAGYGIGRVYGGAVSANVMAGVDLVSTVASGAFPLPTTCLDITSQGVSASAYLPVIGDVVQRIQGSMTGSETWLYQDLLDLDGDARADFLSARWDAGSGLNAEDRWLHYHNSGRGFDKPKLFPFGESPRHANGDHVWNLQSNANFRYAKTRWLAPSGLLFDDAYFGFMDQTVGLADMNGDGLLDLVATRRKANAEWGTLAGEEYYWLVYYNEGDDFSRAVEWQFQGGWGAPGCTHVHMEPTLSTSIYYEDPSGTYVHDGYVRQVMGLYDANGDGLLDFWHVQPYDGEDGWGADGSCGYVPTDEVTNNTRAEWISYANPQDLNSPLMIRLNNGEGFDAPMQWINGAGFPLSGGLMSIYPKMPGDKLASQSSYGVVGAGDFNADGVPEVAVLDGEPHDLPEARFDLYKLGEGNYDRLATLTTPNGGKVDVSYAFHNEPGGEMGPGLWVVDSLTIHDIDRNRTEDGSDVLARRTFRYEHGYFDRAHRDFLGFERIYQYSAGTAGYTLSRYLQTKGMEGLLYCREVRRNDTAQANGLVVGAVVADHLAGWQSAGGGMPSGHGAARVVGSPSKAGTRLGPRVAAEETSAGLAAAPDYEDSGGAVPDTAGHGGSMPAGGAADDATQEAAEQSRWTDTEDEPYDGVPTDDDGGDPAHGEPGGGLSRHPLETTGATAGEYSVPVAGAGRSITSWRPQLYAGCSEADATVGMTRFTCTPDGALDGATCGDADDPGVIVKTEFNLWSDLGNQAELHTPRLMQSRELLYDAAGADPRTTQVSYVYDGAGNVTDLKDYGDITTTDDDLFTRTTYAAAYDPLYLTGLACRKTVTDAGGAVLSDEKYGYDGDPIGSCAAPSRRQGLLSGVSRSVASGVAVSDSRTYTTSGMPWVVTDERGNSTTYGYDGTYPWMLTSERRTVRDISLHTATSTVWTTLSLTSSRTYHGVHDSQTSRFGLLAALTDANGQTVTYEYDALRRPTLEIQPGDVAASPTASYSYDTTSIPWRTTTSRKILGTRRLQSTTSLDGFGRAYRVESSAPANAVGASKVRASDQRFDADGRVVTDFLPYFAGTTRDDDLAVRTTYDLLGRPTSVRGPNGATAVTSYDRERITSTDPEGHARYSEVDARGRTVLAAEYTGGGATRYRTTRRSYRADGALLGITDEAGNVWTYEVDRLGRVTRAVDPDTGEQISIYDGRGNRVVSYDSRYLTGSGAGKLAASATYDELDRPQKRVEYASATVTGSTVTGSERQKTVWYWDLDPSGLSGAKTSCATTYPRGRIGRIDHYEMVAGLLAPVSQKEFCYDARGRMTRLAHTIRGRTYTTDYGYNGLDLPTSITYPDGSRVTSGYDDGGQVSGISRGTTPLVSGMQYAASGQPLRRVLGGGAAYQYWCYEVGPGRDLLAHRLVAGDAALTVSCDPNLADPAADVIGGGPGHVFANHSYTLDGDGRVAAREEETIDAATGLLVHHEALYEHDDQHRLTSEIYDGGAPSTYAYDTLDNLVTRAGAAQCFGSTLCGLGATASKPHQLNSTGIKRLSYDAAGNAITWKNVSGTWSFDYDLRNRLLQTRQGTAVKAVYNHDEDGVRVFKGVIGGQGTDYSAAGYRVNDVTGTPWTEVAHGDYGVTVTAGGPAAQFYTLKDPFGSASVVIDAAGAVVQSASYAPYGAVRAGAKAAGAGYATDRLFNGKEREEDVLGAGVNVYDFGPRQYDAAAGVWLSPDSTMADGLNRYAFVGGDPVGRGDPSGRTGAPLLIVVLYMALPEYWQGRVHVYLDIGGFSPDPVFGPTCDAVNCVLYMVDGDPVNASISAIGAIPGEFGDAAKGPRVIAYAMGGKTPRIYRTELEQMGVLDDLQYVDEMLEADGLTITRGRDMTDYPYERHRYSPTERDDVFVGGMGRDGYVRSPSGKPIEPGDKFDVGHVEPYRIQRERAETEYWDDTTWDASQTDMDNLRPELPYDNRSGLWDFYSTTK